MIDPHSAAGLTVQSGLEGDEVRDRLKETAMWTNSHDFIRPANEAERAYLESLVRADYDGSHPDDTFEDMKRRSAFTKEDRGLYRDWIALAAARAEELRAASPQPIAA
jgi:hypothetical protein